MSNGTCSIEGCSRAAHARGWCSVHYGAWRRKGDPNAGTHRHFAAPAEALLNRTVADGDCRVWVGYKTKHGYGMLSSAGRLVMVHRYVWEAENGPIPEGMEIDHTCWNRACCNVAHLRLATHQENGRNRNGALPTSRTGIRNVRMEGDRFRVIVNREHVGTFDDATTAMRVAERERNAKFGEFAGRG